MERKTLLVNLFGGAGAGKSTLRARLFYEMKIRGICCEEVTEWIKDKVYEENPYVTRDQIYVFAKQRKKIMQIMGKVDVIITDSPLLLSVIYDQEGDALRRNFFLNEIKKIPSMSFFVERGPGFDPVGRFGNREDAVQVDNRIKEALERFGFPCQFVQQENAWETVLHSIRDRLTFGEEETKSAYQLDQAVPNLTNNW